MEGVYSYDGKKLSALDKLPGTGMGIIGLFSVNSHPTEPNVVVFYHGDRRQEFHHPENKDYNFHHLGFHNFLKEFFDTSNVCGGKLGVYIVREGGLDISSCISTKFESESILNRFPFLR